MSEWIDNTGTNPWHAYDVVEIELGDGRVASPRAAGLWNWRIDGLDSDIIRSRLISKHGEPANTSPEPVDKPADDEHDESRMDIIGQNGSDGLHYPAPANAQARKADALADPMTAPSFCQKAADLMAERGKTYDKGGKAERSMAATVTAFNAITGRDLSEPEGWLLMSLVKRVRQYQNPSFHRDSAEDAVAYAALEAEALAAEDAA